MQILIIRSFSFDSLKKIVNFEPDKELKATRDISFKVIISKLRPIIIWKTLKRKTQRT